ncbi:MAG: hypothetical protein Q4D96_00495 [Propionibacteriaceae bacterium]|nr:hypothetical protein [Propionibacteriaceae bacterium]
MTHPGPQFTPAGGQPPPPPGWSPGPPPPMPPSQLPPGPPPGGWYQAPPPPPRRNGPLIAAIIAVVVVIAVMAGYLLWPKGNDQATPEPQSSTSIEPPAPSPSPTPESTPPSPTPTATAPTSPPAAQQVPGDAPPPVPEDLVTVHPELPAPTPTATGSNPTNPGYNPENGRGGFIQPRENRPPIEAPDATPEQTWPTIPDPGPWTGAWQTVAGERGIYQVPSDWKVEGPGVLRGYQVMGRTVGVNGIAVHGPDACQASEDLSFVGITKATDKAVNTQKYSRFVAHLWALVINTEWEGDYYLVPDPVTMEFPFADGTKGHLSTVTFVPKTKHDCDFPAIRVSAAIRTGDSGQQAHAIVAVSYVGKEGELGVALERQVLSSFRPPE